MNDETLSIEDLAIIHRLCLDTARQWSDTAHETERVGSYAKAQAEKERASSFYDLAHKVAKYQMKLVYALPVGFVTQN